MLILTQNHPRKYHEYIIPIWDILKTKSFILESGQIFIMYTIVFIFLRTCTLLGSHRLILSGIEIKIRIKDLTNFRQFKLKIVLR